MSLPNLNEIREIANNYKLSILEGRLKSDEDVMLTFSGTAIEMVQEFMKFANTLNKSIIFANVFYIEQESLEEEYLIDIESLREEDYGDFYKKVTKEAKKYNEQLMNLPIDEPAVIELLVIDGNTKYKLSAIAEWSENLKDSEEAFEDIYSRYEASIEEQKEKKKVIESNIRDKVLDQLEEELLSDELFKKCTTKISRYGYVLRLLHKHQAEHLITYRKDIEAFADLVWVKLKSNVS